MQPDETPSKHSLRLEEAQDIVFNWAVENSVSPAHAVAVIEAWHAEGVRYRDKKSLLEATAVFHNSARNMRSVFQNFADLERDRHSAWSLEGVKHIAIASVTGLAGSATLIASSSKNNWTIAALVCFFLALALTIVAFFAGAALFLSNAGAHSELAEKAEKAQSYDELIARLHEHKSRKRRPHPNVSVALLLLAIVALPIGVYCIVRGV